MKHRTFSKIALFISVFVLLCACMSVCAFAGEGYDLRTVSAHTPESIADYMHPETRHLAADVIRVCRENGVSAEFIVSVMRWERRPDLHNWFGWTGSGGSVMSFDSDLDCLERIIPLIKRNYLTEGGRCFNGYTVDAVSVFYNNSDFWRDTIEGETLRVLAGAPGRFVQPVSALGGSKLMLNTLKGLAAACQMN